MTRISWFDGLGKSDPEMILSFIEYNLYMFILMFIHLYNDVCCILDILKKFPTYEWGKFQLERQSRPQYLLSFFSFFFSLYACFIIKRTNSNKSKNEERDRETEGAWYSLWAFPSLFGTAVHYTKDAWLLTTGKLGNHAPPP